MVELISKKGDENIWRIEFKRQINYVDGQSYQILAVHLVHKGNALFFLFLHFSGYSHTYIFRVTQSISSSSVSDTLTLIYISDDLGCLQRRPSRSPVGDGRPDGRHSGREGRPRPSRVPLRWPRPSRRRPTGRPPLWRRSDVRYFNLFIF